MCVVAAMTQHPVTQSPSGRRRFPWKSIVRTLVLTGAAVLAAATAGPVFAQSRLLDEVWVGGFAHDTSDLGAGKESNTEDAMVEVDSGRPGVLRFLGAPRIGASLSLNTAGLSNFGALSLVWDHHLFSRHRLLLGSKVLFREAGGLDWRLSDHWRVGAEFVHLSNGLILAKDHNQGINDAGLRLGYEF
jgi:hypothetical protein